MIRINRLIKKSSLYKVLELPHVAKVEIIRRKTNQKDPSVIRICIYLTQSHAPDERTKFLNFISHMLNVTSDNDACSALCMAKIDGFIKESTYNKFGFPSDNYYGIVCNKYNQEFFDNL